MASKKTKHSFICITAFVCFSMCAQLAFAQSLHTSINKKSILIGEQIKYDLQFVLPSPSYSIEFNLPDSFPHFDIISKEKSDSTDAKGNYMVMQRIVLTSFDSGQWHLPVFPIKITNANKSYTVNTDSTLINVGYAPADSTGQLRDIKPVIDVFVIDNSWLYIFGGVITAIILFILVYRYFKHRKKKEPPVFNSSLSPYDEAMQALNNLSKYNLQNPVEIKEYHSVLADIFKRFISRKGQLNVMNRTTGDLLIYLKEHGADIIINDIASILRTSDAVKFAKFLPSMPESNQNQQVIKNSIEILSKSSNQK